MIQEITTEIVKHGKWLILTRTKSNLLEIMKDLKNKNYYYQSNKGKSYRVALYKAAIAYTKWRNGEKLEEKEIEEVKDFIPNGDWDDKIPWYDKFVADQKEILYIRNLLSNKENLDEPARIWLSTIHASKGGEGDNVLTNKMRSIECGMLGLQEHAITYTN